MSIVSSDNNSRILPHSFPLPTQRMQKAVSRPCPSCVGESVITIRTPSDPKPQIEITALPKTCTLNAAYFSEGNSPVVEGSTSKNVSRRFPRLQEG